MEEIVDLHLFFERWLGGNGPKGPHAFARLEDALAPGFTMVNPTGRRLSRAEVVGWIRDGYGAKAEPAPFSIAIRDCTVLHEGPGFVAVTYLEEQVRGGGLDRRIATALFEPHPERAGAVRWLLVHETGL